MPFDGLELRSEPKEAAPAADAGGAASLFVGDENQRAEFGCRVQEGESIGG